MPIEDFRWRPVNGGPLDDARAMNEDVNLTDIGHQATDDIEKLRIAGKVCGKTVGSPAETSRLRRDNFERLQSAADEANSNSLRRER